MGLGLGLGLGFALGLAVVVAVAVAFILTAPGCFFFALPVVVFAIPFIIAVPARGSCPSFPQKIPETSAANQHPRSRGHE
jgi:hypothetical protein